MKKTTCGLNPAIPTAAATTGAVRALIGLGGAAAGTLDLANAVSMSTDAAHGRQE
jgi:hypothetical protein